MSSSGDFLQWLRTFALVAETGSLHKAAEILYLSPAAISHHIRKLEQDLDEVLFERTSQGMELTAVGRQIRERCLSILDQVDAVRRMHSLGVQVSGPIRLTGVNRQLQYVLPQISSFRELHSEVRFIIEPAPAPRVIQNVLKGSADAAIVIYKEVSGELKFVGLRPSSAYLYTPPGNPFNLPETPSWEAICELPFISLTLDGYVNPVMPMAPQLRQPHNIVFTVNDFMLAMQMVKHGYGVCICPPFTHMENPDDYSAFNIDHVFPIGVFGYLIRRDAYLAPQTATFLRYLEKHHTTLPVMRHDISNL